MKGISVLVSIFFMLVFIAFGVILLGIAFAKIGATDVVKVVEYLSQDLNSKLISGLGGLLLIFLGLFSVRVMVGPRQQERTIAFNNPDGQVQISLAAIEDFIKRLSYDMSGLKELKPRVTAGRKGMEIFNRISFYSGTSIPEAAGKIQSLIKNRVQEMLGIEEPIIVKVHVSKIVQKEKGKPKEKEIEEEPKIPYR